MILLGLLEDNINLLTIPVLYKYFNAFFIPWFGYPIGKYFEYYQSNQPFIWLPFVFFARFFDPIYVYNFFIVFSKILTIIFSYKLFDKVLENKKIAVGLAIIMSMIPYLEYQSRSHVDLAQIWVFPLYLLILSTDYKKEYSKFMVLGLFGAAITLISNYFGYFILLFTSIFLITFYGLQSIKSNKYLENFLKFSKSFIVFVAAFVLPLVIFLWPYFSSNYLTSNTELADTKVVRNNIEDFFYFNSRPWYYILPAIDNPISGSATKYILNYLENDIGYWLAKNYFASEHAASYLGGINILLMVIGVFYFKKHFSIINNNYFSLSLILTGIVLIILTMPPYFTFAGFKIYMPSYLLMHIFPMFRSLVRFAPLIMLIVLTYAGYGLRALDEKFKKSKFYPINFNIILLALCFLSIADLYVPIRITYYEEIPSIYSYIRNSTAENSVIVSYPYNKSGEVTFWLREFHRPIINPVGFNTPTFASQKFTDNLVTCEGITQAKELGATHLLFFPNIGKDRDKSLAFFENTLKLQTTFAVDALPNISRTNFLYVSKDIGGDQEQSKLYDLKNSSFSCPEND